MLTTLVVAAFITSASPLQQTVTVSASIERPTCLPGEPVVLYVTLQNTGDTAVTIPEELTPEYGRIRYFIRLGDGAEVEFRSWAMFDSEARRTLPPKGFARTVAKVFFGANGWTFSIPGSYSIRAQFGAASSIPVALVVEAPTLDADRRISSAIVESREAGMFLLLDGGDHLSQGMAVVRQAAESNTRFAGYATYALGANLALPFANLVTGAERRPDLVQAESLLKRSQTMLPDTALYYRIESSQRLGTVLRERGRMQEALQLDNRLQQTLRQTLKDDALQRQLTAEVRGFVQSVIR